MRSLPAALALVLLAPPASALSTDRADDGTPIHWARPAVPFVVDTGRGPPREFANLAAIVDRAAARWAEVPNAPRLQPVAGRMDALGYDGRRADNVSGVVVYSQPPPIMSRDALAVTLLSVRRSTGEIIDADVVVNAWRHRFDELGPAGMMGERHAPYDIENVVTHELGHALGLNEDLDEPEATMAPTASPGEVRKRTLEDVDRESLRLAYAGVALAGPQAGCGGARVAPARIDGRLTLAALGVALLALAVARARARKGTLVAAAGVLLVAGTPGPAVQSGLQAHRVTAALQRRVDGVLTTRAEVVDAQGVRRTVELLGGREGDLETRVYDAPSGSDLRPGATVEMDGDRVVRVGRPASD